LNKWFDGLKVQPHQRKRWGIHGPNQRGEMSIAGTMAAAKGRASSRERHPAWLSTRLYREQVQARRRVVGRVAVVLVVGWWRRMKEVVGALLVKAGVPSN